MLDVKGMGCKEQGRAQGIRRTVHGRRFKIETKGKGFKADG
jgi:hypothetical protein